MELTDDWIIGFVEGEGCFHHVHRWKNGLGRYARFTITQINREILEQIRAVFGFGQIYEYRPKKPNEHIRYSYVVNDQRCLAIIRDFFKGRLRTEFKTKQFEVWEKLLTNYLTPEEKRLAQSKGHKKYWDNHPEARIRLREIDKNRHRDLNGRFLKEKSTKFA